jgi:hypothetical protein
VGELRRLRVNDLVSQNRERFLRVRGKGARERWHCFYWPSCSDLWSLFKETAMPTVWLM